MTSWIEMMALVTFYGDEFGACDTENPTHMLTHKYKLTERCGCTYV
jgi:hypothetical protein